MQAAVFGEQTQIESGKKMNKNIPDFHAQLSFFFFSFERSSLIAILQELNCLPCHFMPLMKRAGFSMNPRGLGEKHVFFSTGGDPGQCFLLKTNKEKKHTFPLVPGEMCMYFFLAE